MMKKEQQTIKKLEAYNQPIVRAYGFETEKGFLSTKINGPAGSYETLPGGDDGPVDE